MKWTSTLPGNFKKSVIILISLISVTLISTKSYAQSRIYANQVTIGTAASDHVDNPGNAILTDNSFATVKSYGGLALGVGKYNGQLELKFPGTLPAGTTSFLRIGFDPTALEILLGGNLGGTLADIAGGLILGNHYFNIEARNGGTAVLSGSSSSAFPNPNLRLIQDADGNFYIALTPALAYDRIYIQDVTDALLFGQSNETRVYNAFYTNGVDPCAQAFATGYEGTGLTLDILKLGKAGVTNPENAIDANPNNFSELSLGILGVAGTISQNIYFETLSNPTDDINIKIQADPALLNLGLLNNVSVTAYNGSTAVGTTNISAVLNLDLLGLLNSGQAVSVPFAPGLPYNRVKVTMSSLLNVSVTQTLNLYAVTRSAGRPTFTAPASNAVAICSGNAASLRATTAATNELRWYESPTGGTALATVAYNAAFVTPALNAGKTYYVAARRIGCIDESVRVPVVVTVTAMPVAPAVTAVAPICAGSTATLTVTSPAAGVAYRWYTSPTGGTALATGNNYITSALSASTTFYVEGVTGTCVSTSRTAVVVNVNPLPGLPSVVTNNETISAGQTATLQATATAGNTIKWFAGPTGGVALATGSSFTTPVLTATTTYYVGTENASGCSSATRVPVTVTVIGGPVNPNCNAAVAQQTGIDGICLLCGIEGAGNSTDADPANFTKINLTVGVLATGYQRLIFANGGVATDSIRLDLATPVGLADLSALGGATIRVMNGADVVSTYALSSALIDLKLLSGNRFKATFLAGGSFDRVEIRFGAVVAALSNLSIYGAEIIYPNPTVSAAGQTICSGSTTTLSAAANGGTTLRWYTAPTGGTLLHTGENFTTPVLTATTTYYIEVSKGSCANTQRIPVKVTVTTPPAVPVVAAVPPVCFGSGAVISIASPVSGVTYNWYTAPTGGTPVFSGSTFTTPALTANTTYYVGAANGNCISASRRAVAITVSPLPVLPQIVASATSVNPGQTAMLTATSTETNVTFNWYTSATSTTPVFTGPTYITPPLTVTTTYYLEAKSNVTGCSAASRVQVTITVNGGGGPNPVPCEAPIAQVNGVTGVALLAGVFNPQLAIDNNTTTASSLVMPVGLLGAYVYQRLTFANLSNVGDTVRVLLTAPGKLLSLGLLSKIQVSTYNNNTSNNDGISVNDPLIRLELLSGNTAALISFVPTQQFDKVEVGLNSGLAGALTTIDLNYAQRVAVAPEVISSNVAACATQTAVLTVKNPKPGITYKWYSATGVYQAGKDGVTFTTPVLTASTRYFVEANTASGCTSYRTPVNVTVTPTPQTPALVSAAINTCTGNTVVLEVKNPLVGVTYKWYNSTGVYQTGKDGITFTVAGIAGTTTYSVEAVNSCGIASAAKATATINVGNLDIPVITPAAVTVRSGSPAVLTATSSTSGAIFRWYATATSPVVLFTGSRVVTPALINNGTTPITVTYYVDATVAGGCPASGRASVVVTIIPNGSPTDVPCEPATVSVRAGVDGVALLAAVFNEGLAVDNNTESASSFVMPVGALGASVYQQVAFNGLSNVGDAVQIRISSPGKLLSLAVLPSIEITTFKGAVSNNDMLVASNPIINLELLSDNSGAIITFVPQKQFDGVELRLRSGLAAVLTTLDFNFARRIIAAPKVSSAAVIACSGTSATLAVSNPVAGITYKWYSGTTYLSGNDGATLTTDPGLPAGTYNYFVSATRNGCESAKTKVTVTILAAPLPPVAAVGNPATTCPNTSVSLSVNAVAGVTFNWYDALTGGNLLATNTNTYAAPASLAVGGHNFYVEAVNGNSCTSTAARTKITLTVNPTALTSDITVTGATAPFCAGIAATLTASSTTVTSPVFTWYTDAALTNAVFTGPVFITPVLTASRTYYVTVRGANKCANTAANAKVVALTVNPPSTAADLDVAGAGVTFCSGTTAKLTASTTTVTNPVFTWYTDAALTNAVFTGAVFTTPVLTTKTIYYVTVKGANRCENLASGAEVVTLNVNPPALAADVTVAGAGSPFCAGAKAALTATSTTVTNPVFTWYTDAALTNAVFTGAVFNTPVLTATRTYYVTVKGTNKCENTAATAKTVVLTVNPPAVAIDVNVEGASTPFCAGTSARLTASSTTVTNPVFTWYTDAALTNAVFTGAIFDTPLLTATRTYYVSVKGVNKCENLAGTARTVVLTVNPPAVATDITVAGAGLPFCAGVSAKLTATSTTVTGPIFTWYSDAALTNAVFTGPVFDTPVLTANKTYYVTVRGSNKCENNAANAKIITLTVNPPALPSDITVAGAGASFCVGNKATLTATTTTVLNPVFTWYLDAALTNAVFTGAIFETPVLTATTTYYVTVKGTNKCENTSATARAVRLTVNPLPETPVVSGAGVSICSGESTMLSVQNTQAGVIYRWYDAATGGTLLHTGPQYTTLALNATTDFYVMAVSPSGCGSATGRTKATVNVSPKPLTPAVASATVNACIGSTAVLSVSNPQTGVVYSWYATSTGGTALGSGQNFTTPVINANTVFYVGASAGTCTSASRTAVTVNAAPLPAAPASISGAGGPQCSSGTTVLSVDNPNAQLTYKWYTVQTGGTSLADGNTFTTPVLTATTTYYVEAVNTTTGCPSTTRTAVVVTVLAKLDAPVVSVQSVTGTSITFQWNAVPGATAYEVSIDNGLTWIAPTAGPAGTTYLYGGLQPDQTVTIRVRAKGQLDCQLSDATTFSGKTDNPLGNTIFVPNTFTPNNDGKNDVLYVYGNTIAKIKFRVYNQWGQFLYESLNIQNGWDGTYKGDMQPNGVYVYYLDADFNDGTKTTKKGTITLLR